MTPRPGRALALVLLGAGALARPAGAAATFVLDNVDQPGVGFNETTRAVPVGGNNGTTVGEQRRIAFQAALDIWAKTLDSAVPIHVAGSFAPLTCSGNQAILGQAQARAYAWDEPGLPAGQAFPIALANRLAGTDIDPQNPDIEATFNGDLSCIGQYWYYGLDGKPSNGNQVDLIGVVIHEVAHGLGFASIVDDESGALPAVMPVPDPFTSHLFDNSSNKRWSQMTAAERFVSFTNPRRVVWDGANVTAAAARILARGAPAIAFTPSPTGMANVLYEANFGPMLSAGNVTGNVSFISSSSCSLPGSYSGRIPLFDAHISACSPLTQLRSAQAGGAIAAVFVADRAGIPAPYSLNARLEDIAAVTVTIPSVLISAEDGALLRAAGATASVQLSANAAQGVGSDAAGRVYLYASDPVVPGSSISHWDPLVRPDLVMEPADTPEVVHTLDMERALMIDIGWTPTCGNGKPDQGEECDSGSANSDIAPNTCRTTCKNAACGDGVVDTGEECDQGAANNDSAANVCRTNCKKGACGDHVVDLGEECDWGTANNDNTPNACRTACRAAHCGDGVVDDNEQCDPGAAGSSAQCRPDCTPPPSSSGGCGCAVGEGTTLSTALVVLLSSAWTIRRRRRRSN